MQVRLDEFPPVCKQRVGIQNIEKCQKVKQFYLYLSTNLYGCGIYFFGVRSFNEFQFEGILMVKNLFREFETPSCNISC